MMAFGGGWWLRPCLLRWCWVLQRVVKRSSAAAGASHQPHGPQRPKGILGGLGNGQETNRLAGPLAHCLESCGASAGCFSTWLCWRADDVMMVGAAPPAVGVIETVDDDKDPDFNDKMEQESNVLFPVAWGWRLSFILQNVLC
jgi:hypothetical protein